MEHSLTSAQFIGIAAVCVALMFLSIPVILSRINAKLAHQNRLLTNMLCVLDPDGSKWCDYEARQRARAEARKK